jgi:hypothetical protein
MQQYSQPDGAAAANYSLHGDLSSRSAEQELIQFVRAEADNVDGPNLLG